MKPTQSKAELKDEAISIPAMPFQLWIFWGLKSATPLGPSIHSNLKFPGVGFLSFGTREVSLNQGHH